MSLDATVWAWQSGATHNLRPAQRIILLSLADRANEQHIAFPSITRLELDTGLDRKTIKRHIKTLEDLGLVKIDHGRGAVNVYQLLGVNGRHETRAKNGPGPKTDQVQKRTTSRAKNGPGGRAKNGPHNLSVESVKNLGGEISARKRASSCPFDPDALPDEMRKYALEKRPDLNGRVSQVWETFVSHHQANGVTRKDWRAAWRTWFSRETLRSSDANRATIQKII